MVLTSESYRLGWLIGLIEGEGCFYLRMVKNKTNELLFYPMFQLTLHEDDKPVLEQIAKYLRQFSIDTKIRTTGRNYCELIVNRMKDNYKLIFVLNRGIWYSKKYKDFLIWSEVLKRLVVNQQPLYGDDFNEIMKFREQLNQNGKSHRKYIEVKQNGSNWV